MNKTEIVNKATRAFHRAGLKLKKHSPEIMVIAGTVGVVASAVMACKATTKLDTVLEENKKKVKEARDFVKENGYPDGVTEEDFKKDIAIMHIQTGVKVVKLYAPSVALGALSLTGIIGSHHILRKRNIALGTAYATINKNFKDYRGRVAERLGEDMEKEIRYNIKAKEFEEIEVDEKGKEKKVKSIVNVADDPNQYSPFARFFDDGCSGWEKDPEHNLTFLKHQQNYANDRLKAKGHLFLNEVYDMLGIPRTKMGQTHGWIYDEECPNGDNYVSFGIWDTNRESVRNFVNGYERTILLDFNVDGNILDLM